jgi:predicted small lipoprotein YifL
MKKLFLALMAVGLLGAVAYAGDKAPPPSGKAPKPAASDAAKRRDKENRERPPATLPERHNQGNAGKKD